MKVLMTETYRIINGITTTNYGNFFSYYEKIRRNARNVQEIYNENRKTEKYGIEAISNRNQSKSSQ